tara:strand:+ start:1746 stop:2921 length:1176 start_codon:yes stop_codon:yes gene_type:complete
MDTHTDTAAVAEAPEAPAVEQLPNAEPESFADALESALSNLDSSPQQEEPVAIEPTPTPEPEASTEVTPEPAESTAESTEATEPIENLSEDVGDDWTPKAANRFKQLKSELKDNRSEVERLRQTVKEQESKMQEMAGLVENRDIEELQSRVAAYEEEKFLTNLEGTQAYKEAVTDPLNSLVERADAISEQYEIDKDALIDVISMEDEAQQDAGLTALLPDVHDRDRAKIYRIIEDLKPVIQRRDHLAANAEAAYKEAQMLEEQRRNAAAAERAEVRSNVTRNVVDRINEKLPFLSGVENLDMGAIQTKAAELDPSVVHPVDFAYNAVAAQLLPTIVREYMTSRKEAEALMDKLSEYEGAEPTMSGSPAADGSTRPHADLSFADAINAALGG